MHEHRFVDCYDFFVASDNVGRRPTATQSGNCLRLLHAAERLHEK